MMALIGLAIFVLYVLALIDILKSSMDGTKKLLWILVVLFVPVFGIILYFVIGRKKTG